MSKKTDHFHVYERLDYGRFGGNYFRCTVESCSHYIHKTMLVGKKAKCRCGAEYILDREQLKRKNPRCPNCKEVKGFAKGTSFDSVLRGVIRGLPLAQIEIKEKEKGNA